jgi:hypothetical protein
MKQLYLAPTAELIPMDVQQHVMSTSTNLPNDFGGVDGNSDLGLSPTATGVGYGSGSNYTASGSDLEDMINDILTY